MQPVKFSLNHMVAPSMTAFELLDAARALGLKAVELRNDVQHNSLSELENARAIGARAQELGIEILSINALYPFNIWNDERAEAAEHLAQLAHACGAQGLVMCPLNDAAYTVSAEEKQAGLLQALAAIKPILERYNLKGFIEPLGFPISSLRLKRDAVAAIEALDAADRFGLVHDTFHHQGAAEHELFPQHTGLVHISGVEDPAISFDDMLDAHRVLVGPKDRLGNVGQIRALLAAGFSGYISFEPFSSDITGLAEPLVALEQSIRYISQRLEVA
ncbi:TIM barrel protein [Marinobacterium rhizophilum]|uniref:TIM barrel protein n=1 Tax=Marinobacterium rhizophilum TaxID=420402 RepID=A0ABY5HL84_9GAMM|nr:TIM barrel protein [Marinobacterium rhizophilum]UTW12719.1 TIM barrel protein [Marinobacterium rhizophilum]